MKATGKAVASQKPTLYINFVLEMVSQVKRDKSTKKNVPVQKGDGSECAICLKDIVDRSDKSNGEDSIFCEGMCQRWLHHTCAGLTDPAFDLIRKSNDKFYCYQCFVITHYQQVQELRDSIDLLSKEVSSLKSQLLANAAASHYSDHLPVAGLTYSDAVSGSQNQMAPQDVRMKSPPTIPAIAHLPPKSTVQSNQHSNE